MDSELVLRGAIIGFSIAAPVGPIGLLCIRRTLAEGRMHGFVSGLGAAAADTVYGCIAAFGLTVLMNFLIDQRLWLQSVGALFLICLGYTTYTGSPAERSVEAKQSTLWGHFVSTFLLTISNPMTILAFMAIFASIGTGEARATGAAVQMVIGVSIGSGLWWGVLASIVGLWRARINSYHLQWINRLSGGVLMTFGAIAIFELIR